MLRRRALAALFSNEGCACAAAIAATFATVAGCANEVIIEDGTTSGQPTSTTGASTSVGSTTSTGPDCSGYTDSEGPIPVTVLIANSTPQPIFVPAECTGAPDFGVFPLGGPDGLTYGYDSACVQTCAELQNAPDVGCGPCPFMTIRIPSGGSREFVWDGAALTPPQQMPSSCWFVPDEASQCAQKVAAPAQEYIFQTLAFADCHDGAEPCACTPEGDCAGLPTGPQAFHNPATISYPSEGKVEILFDICAFGCGDP